MVFLVKKMTNVNEILDNGEEVDGGVRPCNELTKDFLEEFLIQKGADQEKHEKKKTTTSFMLMTCSNAGECVMRKHMR